MVRREGWRGANVEGFELPYSELAVSSLVPTEVHSAINSRNTTFIISPFVSLSLSHPFRLSYSQSSCIPLYSLEDTYSSTCNERTKQRLKGYSPIRSETIRIFFSLLSLSAPFPPQSSYSILGVCFFIYFLFSLFFIFEFKCSALVPARKTNEDEGT